MRTSIRPTVAEVDLGAILSNVGVLRRTVGSGVAIWGVVKADAYGHGAVAVGRALEPAIDALAVSLVEEGLELRAAGIRIPIIVLSAFYNRHQDEVIHEGLTPVIYDTSDLERFAAAATRLGRRVAVHLKVDTGMSRLGVSVQDLPAVIDRALALPSLEVAGLATHFASADGADPAVTEEALRHFQDCVDLARRRGLGDLTLHAANSAATVRFSGAHLDAVRPGLALYGAMPSQQVARPDLRPALRLATRVMALHDVAPSTPVSYGGLWRAARPSRIATLPIGYADGYPRHVRGALTLVRGHKVPVVGAVCMDMLMVDVTDVPGAALGDQVVLIGCDGDQSITVDDLAGWAGTVSYEILCGISKRVPRIYTGAARTARAPTATP
ncbi:MAG TPA: alanine racemase [Polyangia bacterium]|nr:alanine racemase [Polyangia bacterium]